MVLRFIQILNNASSAVKRDAKFKTRKNVYKMVRRQISKAKVF